MLETVREFGLERLTRAARSRPPEIATPHFLALLEQRDLKDSTRPGWMPSNTSMTTCGRRWGGHGNQGSTTPSSAWPARLAWFWYYRGHLHEGQRWLSQALETPADDAAPRPRAWALTGSGLLANVAGKRTARPSC